jgi:hypothetical protein
MSRITRCGAVAGMLSAGVLLAGCLGSAPAGAPPRQHGEGALLTGYAMTSPMDEAGTATTVRISPAAAARIEHRIASLTPSRPVVCEENQLLFSLHVAPPAGSQPPRDASSYTATAVLCPVPGVVTVTSHGGTRSYVATCGLIELAASYLPAGRSGACFRNGG